jgi:tRNAThr (cytosine32-N3)-methyltransferase
MFGAAAGSTTTTAPTTTPLSLDTLSLADSPAPAPRFELLQLGVDRRLLLNRKLQLKMYRIWLQVSSIPSHEDPR